MAKRRKAKPPWRSWLDQSPRPDDVKPRRSRWDERIERAAETDKQEETNDHRSDP